MELSPKRQKKLKEAVRNIACEMCEFEKYKPRLVQERVEDLSPSATIPVTIAVKGKLSESQLSQLKKLVISLGEPNLIGTLVIYKTKMKAESFDGLSKLTFVLDAQLDSLERAVETSGIEAEPAEAGVASHVPSTIATLEAVKQAISEDFGPMVSVQEGKIADSADGVKKIQEDINARGIGYKLKWILGMASDREKKDSEELAGEVKNLATVEENMKKIAEQLSDISAKAALLEQAKEIGIRKAMLEKMSSDKKRSAAGILNLFGLLGGGK